MLEMDVIQMRGFRNTVKDGKVTGFQFRVRSTYYRGLWLSLFRPGEVSVDGRTVSQENIRWEFGGIEYTVEQLLETGDRQWPNGEAAVVKVLQPGGLCSGYHEISIGFRHVESYVPPVVGSDEGMEKMPMPVFKRRMILV